jgi:hypothetical protein
MNIFTALAAFAQNKTGKLMYDSVGNPYLYDTNKKEFKTITTYPLDKFMPFVDFDWRDRDREEKIKQWKDSFDKVTVYSVKVGEESIDGVNKPILRYGFINDKGYAITHATYDEVEAFQNGHARVCLNKQWCYINLQGHPIIDGVPVEQAEFIFNSKGGFSICCTDGKYGVINLFKYLCIPCIYDHISFNPSNADYVSYIELQKNGINYTAFIEGNSICNIVEFKAKSFLFVERYIIIEEEFSDNGKTVNKFGLLSSGGTRLLDSKYDKLKVYHPYFIIATIDGYKQLILPNAKILLDKCDNISYGRYYDEEEDKDLYYFSVNDKYVNIYCEQSQDVGSLFAGDYDEEYFACDKDSSNKYFALVEGGKTKLVDINGDEIIPPVISAEYRVITDKYGEGIVGVSKVIQKEYSDGTPYSQTCYGYINADGKLLCDLIFDGIDKFKDGVAKAYYDSANSRTYCELDKQGKIIYQHTDHGDSEPMDNTWADLIGDAFEGDPDARWNTD